MKKNFKKKQLIFNYNYLAKDLHGFGEVLKATKVESGDDIVLIQVNESGECETTADRLYVPAGDRICRKCGCVVLKQGNKEQHEIYPYFCPDCDEDLFTKDTVKVKAKEYLECLKDSRGRFINVKED